MFPQHQEPGYVDGLNQALLDAVPGSADVVVETGCSRGNLGAALKDLKPGRRVIGVEIDPASAAAARERLDEVVEHDLMTGPPPIERGSVDALLFGDVLEHLVDPERVLAECRDLLSPDGVVLASIPNVAHHTLLGPLLRADFMYQPQGLLDATHLRFFTYATIFKMFLDAGYVPDIKAVVEQPVPDGTVEALTPVLVRHRVDPERARKHLSAFQYIVEARPAPVAPEGFAAPLTIACLVNDNPQLHSNLLRSPVLAPGHPHQLLLLRDQPSAAAGLRTALDQAEHDLVVLVQQDMYLPRGWDHAFRASWEEATAQHGPLGVAGVFGLQYRDRDVPTHVGRVVDRDRLLDEPVPLPALVDSLDEVVLALPRDTPLEPDPALGFHLYGSDLALQARERGLPVVVLDALCQHNSLHARTDAAFHASREVLLATWDAARPLRSNMGALDDLRQPEPFVPWHTQLRRELAATTRRLEAAEKKARRAQRRVKRLQQRVAELEAQPRGRRAAVRQLLGRG